MCRSCGTARSYLLTARLVAFETCRKADRGLNIARIDGSDERRLVDLDGDSLRRHPLGT